MAVFRKVKKIDFTVIDNNIFKNNELSFKGKGMLCTLLSLPEDWNYSEEGLVALSISDGITSVRSALKELMELGYLKRERIRDKKGVLRDYIYTIYEEPTLEKPRVEKPILENLKTYKELNNKELNNKKEIYKERFQKPTLEEIENYCKERNSTVDPKTFFDYFETGNWIDSKGNKVKNWKQKIITWENHKQTKKEEVPEWFNKNLNEEEKKDEEFEDFLRGIEGYDKLP